MGYRMAGTRIGMAGTLLAMVCAGCKNDARLAGAAIKPAVVGDVPDSGLTLDRNATPKMVAFALLRAIKDDVEAGGDLKAREAAFDRQYRLAAPTAIHQHHAKFVGKEFAERDESVFKAVRTWAPTLAYYVDNFNLTWEEAEKAMQVVQVRSGERENVRQTDEQHVLLEVRDYHDDPNASAVVRIRMVQEEGRWRVWWVGFAHGRRHLASAKPAAASPASQPAG